jgi:CDP-diacylglycerol---glycerol-3-phosphate 3-phosphatidyltransferase
VNGTPDTAAPGAPPGRVARIKRQVQDGAHAAVEPLVTLLSRLGVSADQLTIAGLVLSALSGLVFFDGHTRTGALMLLLAGLCDILDGELARRAGLESRFGAFLDSTLDRLSEALVLLGILGFYLRNLYALVLHPERALLQISTGLEPLTWAVVAFTAALALVGSFMVSYTRARAEGLGLDCKVGWFERPERLVLLVVAGLLRVFWAMSAALLLLAILSFATAAQRVAHVHRITRRAGMDRLGG